MKGENPRALEIMDTEVDKEVKNHTNPHRAIIGSH